MSANAGHTLEYLPSYSPDFNHIEPKWVQAKAIRKEGCSIEQFFATYEIWIILATALLECNIA
jgi:transposase